MGLCKCPKRQVTNQFCFEHCVNVCEYCLVRQHKKCIVQSYLQWLKDSDYDASCKFCGFPLQDDKDTTCVRLVCYHVFHWNCLNEFQSSLPLNTTPSGRRCPICADPILPSSNLVSPVYEDLRNRLSEVIWSKNDLGQSMICDNTSSQKGFDNLSRIQEGYAQNRNNAFTVGNDTSPRNELTHLINIHSELGKATREPPVGSTDRDENKYQKRTPREIFNRWSRRFYKPASRPFYRKTWFHISLTIFVVMFLIILMASFGRNSSKNNPMLNMDMNPNIINHEN